MAKIYNEQNVFDASLDRIRYVFENFDNICVSFSGGKDSSVMIQLVEMIASETNKKYDVLYIDMECQYIMTIQHIEEIRTKLNHIRQFYWVALPLSLRNAVSVFEPKWICWDKRAKDRWIRKLPYCSINENNNIFPFFKFGMEFEEFVPEFTKWYAKKNGNSSMNAHLVGIRSNESLNRFRTIISTKKDTLDGFGWTTRNKPLINSYSVYPIYDYATEDVWTATFKNDFLFNPVYELMQKNGLSIHEQRLCQPFGDDQRNGLDQYKAIESENWEKLLKRVSGVNFGNIYCRTSALGNIKSSKPEHLTWQEWSLYLLESIGIYNPELEKHYRNKIKKFIFYWEYKCGCKLEDIPDEADSHMESKKRVPSWRRIGRALERNDFMMSRLSFGETKADVELFYSMSHRYDNLLDDENTDSKPLKRLHKKVNDMLEEENKDEQSINYSTSYTEQQGTRVNNSRQNECDNKTAGISEIGISKTKSLESKSSCKTRNGFTSSEYPKKRVLFPVSSNKGK